MLSGYEKDEYLSSLPPTYHWFTPSILVYDSGNIGAFIPYTDLNLSAFLPFLPCLIILQVELTTSVLGAANTFCQVFVRRTGDGQPEQIDVERTWSVLGQNRDIFIQATNSTGSIEYCIVVGPGWTIRVKMWLKGYFTLREA